jgi:GNAT superfamily N-acetyltransferase
VGVEGAHRLEDRHDLAVLWDIRVQPDRRGGGIGEARGRGYRHLQIETQNVNLAARYFYAAQGRHLGAIHRYGYVAVPAVAHEAMLLWYLDV